MDHNKTAADLSRTTNGTHADSMGHEPASDGSHADKQLNGHSSNATPPQQTHAANETPSANPSSQQAEKPGSASNEPNETEPKKRKGGWPKGKKRRKEISTTQAPRAPSTGYVLFLNERRKAVKEIHPELPLAEIMKILGSEWSKLPVEEKQSYLGRAAEDKKRYSEELKIYQQSEAYQTYLKHKQNVQLPIADSSLEDNPSITIQDIEGEDNNELYCKVCNMFFVSVHNKKEHLYGRQHLQALTGEIHKEALELSGASVCSDDESLSNGEGASCVVMTLKGSGSGIAATDINQSMLDFISLNYVRENEIKVLRERLQITCKKNQLLQAKLQELKEAEEKAKQGHKDVEEYGKSLSSQLDNLRMVPRLFGVINF